MTKTIDIVQLYARDMNIYGDNGNVLVLVERLKKYGYLPVVHEYNPGDTLPDTIDIVIGGGGQDSGQGKIQADLHMIAPRLHELTEADTPMLAICGLYQLFGKFFETLDGTRIEGIGIFDAETYGKQERLVGNIVTENAQFGKIIGYENHSGQTFLSGETKPLAKVLLGAGNNLEDSHEGAQIKNVIGSYLHGSLLPKNPALADFLITKAVERRHGTFQPAATFDDSIAERARAIALTRPR